MEYVDVYNKYKEDFVHKGIMERKEAKQKGMWHKIVAIIMVSEEDDGKYMILQRRNLNKKAASGKIALAVAGHVDAGETEIHSVIRECEEEIGLKLNAKDVTFVTKIEDEKDNKAEKKLLYVYSYVHSNTNILKFKIQTEELDSILKIKIDDGIKLFEEEIKSINAEAVFYNEVEKKNELKTLEIKKEDFASNRYLEFFEIGKELL